MKLRTFLYGSILGLGGVLLVLGLSLYGLLGTETGSRWLFEQVRSRVPGSLTVESTRGRFLTNFRLESLHYRSESVDATTQKIALSWNPLSLLIGTFELSHLNIRNAQIQLPKSSPIEGSTAPSEITLPLSVHLRKLDAQNITLQGKDASEDLHLQSLTGRIQTTPRRIRLRPLSLRANGTRSTIEGWFVPGDNYSHDLRISGSYNDLSPGKTLNGTLELKGNRRKTHLDLQLITPEKLDGSVTLHDPLEELRWSGEINLQDVNARTYMEGSPVGNIDGQIDGTGTLQSADISGSIRTDQPEMPTLDLRFQGERSEDGFKVDELNLRTRSVDNRRSFLDLTLGGQYRFSDGSVRGRVQWDPLTFPLLHDDPRLRTSGGLSISGTRRDYSGTASARLRADKTGPGHVSSRFRGDQSSLSLATFTATTERGSLRGSGQIRWTPHLQWTFSVEGSEWSPALIRDDLTGQISFQSKLDGSYGAGHFRSELSLANLEGSLQGEPLSGEGRVLVDGNHYTLRNLRVSSGDAELQAQGTLNDQWDVETHLTLTRLERWDLDLAGSGSLDLTIRGPRSSPLVQGKSDLNHLEIGEYGMEAGGADFRVDFNRNRPSTVNVRADNLRAGERSLQRLTIEGSGPISEHVFSVTAHHQHGRGGFILEGGLKDGRWAGRLRNLHAQTRDLGNWNQTSPAGLVLSDQMVRLAETCLTFEDSNICSSLQGTTERWAGALRANDVPASQFNVLLRDNLRMNGSVDLDATGQYSGPHAMNLDGTLAFNRGSLVFTPDESSDSEVIPVRSSSLTVSLSGHQLSAQLNSDFSEHGQAHGSIRIDTPLPLRSLPDRRFEGTIRGTFTKLSVLHLATDAIQWRSGAFEVDVSGTGPLRAPRLHGTARLDTAQVRLIDPGITVTNLNGTLRADGSSLNYRVSGESGDGTLAVQGTANRSPAQYWETNLQIDGKDFRTVHTETIKLNTSPDLELSLRYPDIVLRGRVKLSKVHLRGLTGLSQDAVTSSEDVRFTDETEPETTQPLSMSTWNFDGLVTIVLGEDIQIQEGGFEGGLAGSITLTEKSNQPTLARGELEIIGGSYRAYGRSLSIRSGRIIFSQTAPENPRLEIEAVRTFRNVVAGVRIRGTAEDPELTLFSEPPMEETDILSYIVLGKPATGATGDRRQMLLQAATAAGFKGGNQLISTLKKRLGLETLQLETEGSLEEGSLAIGKYLSPRLYVSYGVGLFDNQDQIKFRYEFDENWTLEALGGEHTSADLFYRFRP